MDTNGSFTITVTGNLLVQEDRELLAQIISFASRTGMVVDDSPKSEGPQPEAG